MIGDHTETLAKKYLELRQHARDVSQEFINLLDQISSLAFTVIEKAMESTFTGDVKIASDAMKMSSVVELKEHEFLDLLQKRNDELEVAPSLRSILSEVKTITEYGSAISEIAIIKVLEKTA
jgi:Na+/phosphate symporter